MTRNNLIEVKVHSGRQNPWFEGLEKLLVRMSGIHPEVTLNELLHLKPQMWATHSIEFDWGYLPILSFTRINPHNGQVRTKNIFLFQSQDHILSETVLDQISDELDKLIYEDIDETLEEMIRLDEGIVLSKPLTPTFFTLELIKLAHLNNY